MSGGADHTDLTVYTQAPNLLAPRYSRFRVAQRLLLTGHSHQAWPDVAAEGQVEAFEDAARYVDGKWEGAAARAEEVRDGYRLLLGDLEGQIALGGSTHELVVRFLSGLDLRSRPRLVTTDGEFHSLRRQLARLEEEGIETVRVAAEPVDSLTERLADEVDDRTAAVLVSAVLYETSRIVPGLDRLAESAAHHGVEFLVDAYHALGPVPFRLPDRGLSSAWVTGGGYKYLQLGEGNAFLRLPDHADRLRPVVTGWFAEFAALAETPAGQVAYGPGAARFAGATYDPTAHYRAAEVLDFFQERGLTPELLRTVSQHQIGTLMEGFDDLDLDPAHIDRDRHRPLDSVGGFLALRTSRAQAIHAALRERGVHTDYRGDILRLGPAPYLSDRQLRDTVEALGEVGREL